MKVAVVVPWRDVGCRWRNAAWRWVHRRLVERYPDWPVVLGGDDPGRPFSRSRCIVAGAAATDADVLVVHDADVWFAGDLADYVDVFNGSGWAVPHWHLRRLTEPASAAVLDGAGLDVSLPLEQPAYKGNAAGTLLVVGRRLLFDVPPDPRFEGWGQEDDAWAAALTCLAGPPARGSEDLFHLWHPPQQRMNRVWGNPAGVALANRYSAVARDRDGMRGLVAEARRALAESKIVATTEISR